MSRVPKKLAIAFGITLLLYELYRIAPDSRIGRAILPRLSWLLLNFLELLFPLSLILFPLIVLGLVVFSIITFMRGCLGLGKKSKPRHEAGPTTREKRSDLPLGILWGCSGLAMVVAFFVAGEGAALAMSFVFWGTGLLYLVSRSEEVRKSGWSRGLRKVSAGLDHFRNTDLANTVADLVRRFQKKSLSK